MDLGLSKKVVLVTGGSRGIGFATAIAFKRENAEVAIVSRVARAPSAQTGGGILSVCEDLSTPDGVDRSVASVMKAFGRIDVLVNNAGAIRTGPFLETPDSFWMEDWGLKPLSYVRMARAVFPIMQAQAGGRIINVAGLAARNPMPVYLTGAAANAAVISFTKGLAALGAKSNILVTAVSPGATKTERLDDQIRAKAAAAGRAVEAEWAAKNAEYPLGRLATPEDIACVICFLASQQASFLTGIHIAVEGGSSSGVYL